MRNMLVVTVLVAGAYFASYYAPMLTAPGKAEIANRPMDYNFFYRADQKMIGKTDIEDLAAKYGVKITDYVEMPSASLAVDGDQYIKTNGPIGTTYIEAYTKTLFETRFFWCLHGMRSLGMTLH